MKKIKLLTLLLALSTFAFAQTPHNMQWGSYTQNFNSLLNNTMNTNTVYPSGWSVFEYGSSSSANQAYRGSTGSSTAGDAYSYGAANSNERSFGSQASGSNNVSFGFGFINNTGYALTSIDVAATMEQWREGSGAGLDSSYFSYSTTATGIDDTAAAWTSLAALDLFSASNVLTTGALDGNLALNQNTIAGTITVALPTSGTIFFKWIDLNSAGSDDGLSVDDLSLTLYDMNGPLPPGPPTITSTSPLDNSINVPLSTTSLTITLDQAIASLGTGNVTLKDLTNSSSVTVTNVTTSGNTATLGGISLQSNTSYAVQIDSGLLLTGTGAFGGIGNDTTWNFQSENTTPPPAVTSLNETFTGCSDPMFGVFAAHSETGGQNWRCTTFGHNDSSAVRMNGYANGGPKDNIDWLVSPPLDFSGMAAPHLHLWGKLRFPANTTKEILVSTNYSGLGSPTTATWTAVQGPSWPMLDTIWRYFSNTDLTSYKANNFHIAFKYTSDTTNADEWSIDDILVTDGPLSTSRFTSTDLKISVLGDVNSQLNLQTASSKARTVNYSLLDMAGRKIENGTLKIDKGRQQHKLNVSSLNSGLYFLNLSSEQARTAVKFIIK